MGNVIVAFLAWGLFVGWISFMTTRMIYGAKVPDMIKAETEKRIKDLEFDNCFLEKKLSILMKDNIRIIKERNEFASDISKKLKGL